MQWPPKTALITGASSGIGKALALALAQRSCALALSARRQRALQAVAEAAKVYHVPVVVLPCDTQDRNAVAGATHRVLEAFGGHVDLVILNAGVAGSMPVTQFDGANVERVIHTNLMGAVYWLEGLLPAMLKARAGTLVGVSSLAGHRGLPGVAAYSASKAALSVLFESLRLDLKPYGVRAVTVEPGFVRTPMTAHIAHMPFALEADRAAEVILKRIERGKTIIRFPWPMALLMRLVRSLPAWLYGAVAPKVNKRTQ